MKLFGFIPVYGLLIVTGIAIAVIGCSRVGKKRGLGEDIGVDLALWCMPPAVIAARLYYVAFRWELYREDPLSALYIWQGGLAIYGGIIGGVIGGLLYARHKKKHIFDLTDLVAPFLILAQGIGRWGNFVNREAYGYAVTDAAWQFFPAAVNIGGVWHMATFFYESVWDIAGFALLQLYSRRERPRGTVTVLYLVWYGLGRAVIEGLRTDSLYIPGTELRVSQLLSAVMVLLGCAHLIACRIKGKKHSENGGKADG